MKHAKGLFLTCLVLLAASCKAKHAPPPFTLCTYLETGKIFCANNAVPSMENGIEKDIKPSDIVMPPESFNSFYKWGSDLRQKLITCENAPRN